MTRESYDREVTWFDDLEDICQEYGIYNEIEDLFSRDSFAEMVSERISYWDERWTDLRDWLYDLPCPDTDDYVIVSWDDEYRIADNDDFDTYKDAVARRISELGYFDDEENEDGDDATPEPLPIFASWDDDFEPFITEDITMEELMSNTIKCKTTESQEDNEELESIDKLYA